MGGELRYGSPEGRWVIAAAVLGSGVVMLDATVVGIALPAIGRDFGSPLSALQWVMNGYTLTLAALLLFGGSLGDRFGRRRVFVAGLIGFGIGSLLCAVAWSVEALILARALQGVGGAMLTPGSLALLQSSFRAEDRPRAIGAWSGLGGVASALGPFLGGYLIATFSWRWIFFVNLPLIAAVVLISRSHVPESRAQAGRLDFVGATLVALGLAAVTWGLIAAPDRGFGDPAVVGALAGGVALLVAFAAVERSVRDPMLPLALFASPLFSAANAVTFVVYGALGGALFCSRSPSSRSPATPRSRPARRCCR